MSFLMKELDESDLGRSAIVFSPHPDDETLGCGGTIIRKKRTGADLKIIFMADGCRSHRHLIPENKLKSIRKNEALAASQKLGVEKNDVIFLEYKDNKLVENQNSATFKVLEILKRQEPEEIFVPYYREKHPDHSATNRIVISALGMYQRKINVFEYPIWFWLHWPWTSSSLKDLSFWRNSIVSGLYLLKEFQCSVHIADVLKLKREALEQHKSQMSRLIPDPDWFILNDVSNGEFLECFFQEHEVFHRYFFT